MSYAQRKEMGSNRTAAIVIVALIHVLLGYAIITGLAYNVVKKAAEDLKTFDVEDEPPPPEEPPPPPEDTPLPPPPQVSAPPPLVRIETPAPQIQTTPVIQPPLPPTPVVAPPAPPAPPAPRVSQAAQARGDVRSLFSGDDYPESARDSGATGTARAKLTIGTNGRVTNCTIIQSTGNSALDRTTCSVLTRRAKFTPAKDQAGQPISDTYTTPPIRWQLEG